MKGRGFGLVGNMLVGIVGAAVGKLLFEAIGFRAFGLIANLITATVGALVHPENDPRKSHLTNDRIIPCAIAT